MGSSVHGISQARNQTWVAISFSRGSSQGSKLHLLRLQHFQVGCLPLSHKRSLTVIIECPKCLNSLWRHFPNPYSSEQFLSEDCEAWGPQAFKEVSKAKARKAFTYSISPFTNLQYTHVHRALFKIAKKWKQPKLFRWMDIQWINVVYT